MVNYREGSCPSLFTPLKPNLRIMGQIIGFGGTYYTLWSYRRENQYRTDAYGRHHCVGVMVYYDYHFNISKSRDEALAKYPGLEVDESLRGMRTIVRKKSLNLPEEYFSRGRFAGMLIDEVFEQHPDYCIWAAENMPEGAYIQRHPKYIAHLDELAAAEAKKAADAAAAEAKRAAELEQLQSLGLTPGDVVEMTFRSNGYSLGYGSECEVYATHNGIEVKVLCPGAKRVDGLYPYLMPMINGKCRRTKGKTFTVVVETASKVDLRGDVMYQKISVK